MNYCKLSNEDIKQAIVTAYEMYCAEGCTQIDAYERTMLDSKLPKWPCLGTIKRWQKNFEIEQLRAGSAQATGKKSAQPQMSAHDILKGLKARAQALIDEIRVKHTELEEVQIAIIEVESQIAKGK